MSLPLPIAALARRAHNAKGHKDRHDTAYYAWEASLRLAVSAEPPADPSVLALPSTGTWVSAARFGAEPLDAPALTAAFALFSRVGWEQNLQPRAVTAARLFEPFAAYRNHVLGHGSTRGDEFYQAAAETLLAGLDAAWAAGVFLPKDGALVYVESVEIDAHARRQARLFRLEGAAAMIEDPRGSDVPGHVLPRQLYLRRGEYYRSLHPWLLYQLSDSTAERVLFFNGRSGSARYLDYVSGEELRGKKLRELFPDADASAPAHDPAAHDDAAAAPDDESRFGDFRMIAKLGQGAMGTVYLAEQLSLGRRVALKLPVSGAEDDAVARARFDREIASLSRCDHPNVVKILVSGEVRGRPYYAMELIEGADLSQIACELASNDDFDAAVSSVSSKRRATIADQLEHVPPAEPRARAPELPSGARDRTRRVTQLFVEAARGIDELHRLGILHRDLKPGNLMVTEAEHRLVIMDLGLAAFADASRSITRDKASLVGTLRYMSPEQLQRSYLEVDRRSDIFSLGATFYELLSGRPFHDAPTEQQLIKQILYDDRVPLHKACPSLPRDLCLIVDRATEKDPQRRYQTAGALQRDLTAFLDGRPIEARAPTVGYVLALAVRRNKALTAVIAAFALLVVAGVTAFLWRQDRLVVALVHEQGREELADGHAERAIAYLLRDYARNPRRPSTQFLVAEALRRLSREAFTSTAEAADAHHERVGAVAVSRDGKLMVSADEHGAVRAWDVDRRARAWRLDRAGAPVVALAFTADEHAVLITRDGGAVELVRADSGEPAGAPPRAIVPPPSGAGGAGSAYVIAARTPERLGVWFADGERWSPALDEPPGGVRLAVVSADRRRLAVARDDRRVHVWDLERGARLAEIAPGDWLQFATFSDDGRTLVFSTESARPEVWREGAKGDGWKRAFVLDDPDVHGAVFAPGGGLLVTTSRDRAASVWRLESDRPAYKLLDLVEANAQVSVAVVSPDGRLIATGADDGTVRLWDPRGDQLAVFHEHVAGINRLAFSADGRRLATASDDWSARVFDLAHLPAAQLVDVHGSLVWLAALDPDGRHLFFTTEEGDAHLVDLASGDARAILDERVPRMTCAGLHAGGRLLATPDEEGVARIWDLEHGGAPRRLVHAAQKRVRCVAFDPARARAATAYEQSIQLWPLDAAAPNAEPLAAALEGRAFFTSVAFSGDGQRLIGAATDGTAHVWSIASSGAPALLRSLAPHGRALTYAALSHDGALAITTSLDRTARLWDLASGGSTLLDGHADAVWSAAFNHAGTMAVTAGRDGRVNLWDVATGQRLSTVDGNAEGVALAAFSSDDREVILLGRRGLLRRWDVSLETRPLDEVEREAAQLGGARFSLAGGQLAPR